MPTISTQDAVTLGLMIFAALLAAGAVALLALGLYEVFLRQMLDEAREQQGVRGFSRMSVKRLGRFNQRIMWPGYENRVRRQLIRAGDPQQLLPEEIMSMQELGFIFSLLFG